MAVNSRLMAVSRQYCLNALLVNSPPLSARQRMTRSPQEMTVNVTNRRNESKRAALVLQQVDGGPPGELDCNLADVFETPVGLVSKRAHEVTVAKLERPGDAGMLRFLRMS